MGQFLVQQAEVVVHWEGVERGGGTRSRLFADAGGGRHGCPRGQVRCHGHGGVAHPGKVRFLIGNVGFSDGVLGLSDGNFGFPDGNLGFSDGN